MKNYMKEGQKLPLFGGGPYLIYGMGLLDFIMILLCGYVFKVGILSESWIWMQALLKTN